MLRLTMTGLGSGEWFDIPGRPRHHPHGGDPRQETLPGGGPDQLG